MKMIIVPFTRLSTTDYAHNGYASHWASRAGYVQAAAVFYTIAMAVPTRFSISHQFTGYLVMYTCEREVYVPWN